MAISRICLLAALACAASLCPASGQHAHGYVPPPDIPKTWAQHLWFENGPFVEPYDMGWGARIHFPISTTQRDTQGFFEQGWALLAAGWQDEALRSLRYALYKDPQCGMALWALALTHLSDPSKARTFIEEIPQAAKLTPHEQALISPLRTFLASNASQTDQDNLAQSLAKLSEIDPHQVEPLVAASLVARAFHRPVSEAWATSILNRQPDHPYMACTIGQPGREFALTESTFLPILLAQAEHLAHLGKAKEALSCYGKALTELTDYANLLRQLPTRSPRYIAALAQVGRLLVQHGHRTETAALLTYLHSLPRHPAAAILTETIADLESSHTSSTDTPNADLGDLSWIHKLKFTGWAGIRWALPAVDGKQISTTDFPDRDVLLVFYLGKGCPHCLEQLHAFAPTTKAFRDTGIEIIAISLDSVPRLNDTLKLADPPFPFQLVSDEALKIFRAYDAYDPFERSPIHGTFYVSKSGMVRWADVGHEPFMDADWLLNECQRLQKLDTDLPAINY